MQEVGAGTKCGANISAVGLASDAGGAVLAGTGGRGGGGEVHDALLHWLVGLVAVVHVVRQVCAVS